MFGKIFERNNGLGRDFYTVLEDEPKAKSEESIRQKLKSLKDERNTHNYRKQKERRSDPLQDNNGS